MIAIIQDNQNLGRKINAKMMMSSLVLVAQSVKKLASSWPMCLQKKVQIPSFRPADSK